MIFYECSLIIHTLHLTYIELLFISRFYIYWLFPKAYVLWMNAIKAFFSLLDNFKQLKKEASFKQMGSKYAFFMAQHIWKLQKSDTRIRLNINCTFTSPIPDLRFVSCWFAYLFTHNSFSLLLFHLQQITNAILFTK